MVKYVDTKQLDVPIYNSRGTKVGDRRILAPERYTTGFCMVQR